MSSYIAEMVGGLLLVFLLSRVARLAYGRRAILRPAQIASVYLVLLIAATLLGGFGGADGGSPQFLEAFLIYLPPVLIVAAFDVVRDRARARKPDVASHAP